MLQFNTTVHTIATIFTSRFLWRLNATLTTNAATVAATVSNESLNVTKLHQQVKESSKVIKDEQYAAFNNLKRNLCNDLNIKSSVGAKIEIAQNVHDLLEIMKAPFLSQSDIIKALKVISTWVNENNNSNKSSTNNGKHSVRSKEKFKETQLKESNNFDDLSKYNDLSTNEIIKEINKLAKAGNRNVQVLNHLFQNIIEYNQMLSLGACSNLMFSMSSLCYSDERLLKKICTDIMKTNRRGNVSSTLISIIKSMSYVRYKDDTFFKYVCDQAINQEKGYTAMSVVHLLLSFALLGYHSPNVTKIMEYYAPILTVDKLGHINWLNVIWSYTLLNTAKQSDIQTVLNNEFILKVFNIDPKKKLSCELKLLNINGYAQYALKDYSGPILTNDVISHNIVTKRSKQKESYVNVLEMTLKNMLPSTSHFQMNVNTGMGFLIDAEICLDSDLKPIHVNDPKKQKFTKVAILMLDYYDICLGEKHYHGLIKLYKHLLTCKNYEVLCISYQNFGIEDKIERHISYLRQLLRVRFNKSF